MKNVISTAAGALAGIISYLVGGFDVPLLVLVVFMIIDYIAGLVVAAVFHTSPKSPNGGLESMAGWKGLARKVMTLLLVVVGHLVDLLLGAQIVRTALIVGFCANEAVSILENAGHMGLPIPEILTRSIDQLMHKEGTGHD
ncbi:MAG: phage holin family protein [Oscillospiraceae bacterium]|nr:phage holin family protein [Oscillospiraceae bacterium]